MLNTRCHHAEHYWLQGLAPPTAFCLPFAPHQPHPSYNGYGLMAARSKILTDDKEHVCLPKDASGEFQFNGEDIKLEGGEGVQLDTCRQVVLSSLGKDKACGMP